MRSPSSGVGTGRPTDREFAREVAIFSRSANSSSVRVNGSIERKSRTAGFSSSIVTSTAVDPAENLTTVPTTCTLLSRVAAEEAGRGEGVPGPFADVDGAPGLEEAALLTMRRHLTRRRRRRAITTSQWKER
jgi:hypothetical protein